MGVVIVVIIAYVVVVVVVITIDNYVKGCDYVTPHHCAFCENGLTCCDFNTKCKVN